MITDKDIPVLRKGTSRYVLWTINIAFPLVVILFTFAAVINMKLATRFAELDGLTLEQLLRTWLHGIDIGRSYSGAFVKATEVWTTALLQFTLAYLFFLPIWIAKNKEIARNKRLLTHIEKQ